MKNLAGYLKYYFLEDYLFKEVSEKFKLNKYLTAEEFFGIVIWKSNRAKTQVLKGIKKEKNKGKTVEDIMREVYEAIDDKTRLKVIDDIYGVGIPLASAILSVCYPSRFTISDYRVDNTLEKMKKIDDRIKQIIEEIDEDTNITPKSYRKYFKYVNICQKVAEENSLSLRDLDRCLWAYDFYEGKGGLQELAEGL